MLTARASAAEQGRPLPLRIMVAIRQRYNHQHKIFWKHKHNATADQHNSACLIFDRPCIRRYYDFIGLPVPPGWAYRTVYTPVSIAPKPGRIWVLTRDGEPFVSYSNAVEAWLVMLALNDYEEEEYSLEYKEV